MTEPPSRPAEHQGDAIDRVIESMSALPGVIVGFSGGVDSAVLAALAHRALGDRAIMVTAVSPSLAHRDRVDAQTIARDQGWHHVELETNEIDDEAYARNDPDRCYVCRHHVLAVVAAHARRWGSLPLALGTLADDEGDYRPGEVAADEVGVLRPLKDAGIGKDQVRQIARDLNLMVWDKPSGACLASRIPYGTPVTREVLARVEAAEDALHQMGFVACRVRDHGGCARIEVPPDQIGTVISRRQDIAAAVGAVGYHWVSLDLEGLRQGSLNATLNVSVTIEAGS